MNRCLPLPITRFLTMLAMVIVGTAALHLSPAGAQTLHRQFPPKTQRGTLVVTAPPEITIDGKAARLSPGARIRGSNNLMLMSASLLGQNLLVNYVRDAQGQIHEVWILSPREAQEKLKTADSATPFDPLPQVSRP